MGGVSGFNSKDGGDSGTQEPPRPSVPGLKATHKGHSNNRVLVTKKAKLLYKDDYYMERRVSHKEAERMYLKFCREVLQSDVATSWAGVVL